MSSPSAALRPKTHPSHQSPQPSSSTTESFNNTESLNRGRIFTPASRHSSSCCEKFTSILKVVGLALLFFPIASALSWDCPTPEGSYLDSCDRPVGEAYQSSDPNLRDVKFCRYVVKCKMVNRPAHERRENNKFLPREDLACGKKWVNCHGYAFAQEGNAPMCVERAGIKAQLVGNGIAVRDDEL